MKWFDGSQSQPRPQFQYKLGPHLYNNITCEDFFFQTVQHLELNVGVYMEKDKECSSEQGFVLLVLQHYVYVSYIFITL